MPLPDNPYGSLERIFHEPKRLAILSALCAAPNGLSFKELKKEGDLTDGNLNRHLKTLEEAGIVDIRKRHVGVRPQTRVYLSDAGRERFIDYLEALERVLQRAAGAVEVGERRAAMDPVAPPLEAEL